MLNNVIGFFTISLFIVSCSSLLSKKGSSEKSTLIDTIQQVNVQKTEDIPSYVPQKHPYQASKTKITDLVHTKLSVSFDWEKQYLYGTANLILSPYFYPQKTVVLDAKGFNVDYVKLKENNNYSPLKFEYDSLQLVIYLDTTYTRHEKYELEIKYTAKPNELKKGGSKAISSDKGLYFINPLGEDTTKPKQIWTQGETQASSCWFPTIDAPNQKTSQEMYITVDSIYTVLSNGELVYKRENSNGTNTFYWKQEKPHAPYLFMMAVGEFAKIEDSWKELAVNYYVEKKYAPYAQGVFGNTPEMLGFFSEKLGYEYPWDKYSQVVVRDYVSGAMENTSTSLFMEGLQLDNREQLDKNWDFIIAHELFHHWFGDLVTCESWSNLPLNESFANYSEYLWLEHKYGKAAADLHAEVELFGYLRESNRKQVPLIRYNYRHREDMFDAHSYNKGGLILHMLRNYVGDDAFFESLKYYLHKHEYTDVEIDELRLAFEEVTGEDLHWFFDQWFMKAGHPTLDIQTIYNDSIQSLTLKVTQIQDSLYTPIYELPIDVHIWENGKKRVEQIVIKNAIESIEFNCTTKPNLIYFDGKNQLVGVVNQLKNESELIFQFEKEESYKAKKEALLGLIHLVSIQEQENYYINKSLPIPDKKDLQIRVDSINNNQIDNVIELYKKGLNDDFWKIRQLAIQKLLPYTGQYQKDIIKIIDQIVKTDKKSTVRAEALVYLKYHQKRDDLLFQESFKYALDDSSYVVLGRALLGYAFTKVENKTIIFDKYKNSDKKDIIKSVAEYYLQKKDTLQEQWFFKQFEKQLKPIDQYYFAEPMYQFLKLFSEIEQIKLLEKITFLKKKEEHIYTRLARYKILFLIAQNQVDVEKIVFEKAKEYRLEMIKIEEDETLKYYYEQIFEKKLKKD